MTFDDTITVKNDADSVVKKSLKLELVIENWKSNEAGSAPETAVQQPGPGVVRRLVGEFNTIEEVSGDFRFGAHKLCTTTNICRTVVIHETTTTKNWLDKRFLPKYSTFSIGTKTCYSIFRSVQHDSCKNSVDLNSVLYTSRSRYTSKSCTQNITIFTRQ